MKILHLSNLFSPSIGGLERHVATCSVELARRGHDVAVATLQPEHDSWRALETAGVRLVHLPSLTSAVARRAYVDPSRPFHPTWRDPVVARSLARVVGDGYHVVHSHDWLLHSLRLPAQGHRLVHVHTAHDYGLVCAKKTLVRGAQESHVQPCPGPSVARCLPCASRQYGLVKGPALAAGLLHDRSRAEDSVDVMLAISEAVAREVGVRLSKSRPIDVVPTFVPDGLAELAESTPAPPWLPESPYWLFCGRLSEDKGVRVLLEAYRLVSDRLAAGALPRLLCIGTPAGDLGQLPEGATVQTNVAHAEVMRAHLGAVATVVPSVWAEPLGQVAVEAMLVGTPVIASEIGGLPEVVRPELGTLTRPGDASDLARALIASLSPPADAATTRERARDHALQFTARHVVDRLEVTYRTSYETRYGPVGART